MGLILLEVHASGATPTGRKEVPATADPVTGGMWTRDASPGGMPVVDTGLTFVSAATVDCTAAAHLTATTGAGYITVTNLDASATIYIGIVGVTGSTNGEALPAGASRTWRSADLSLEYAIGSSTVNASIRR